MKANEDGIARGLCNGRRGCAIERVMVVAERRIRNRNVAAALRLEEFDFLVRQRQLHVHLQQERGADDGIVGGRVAGEADDGDP